jgi:uncharacterized protein YndB with AHSA1/START domain
MSTETATMSESAPAKSDREIVVTRVFDAPRAFVFKLWTDPKHVAQWWGPNGFIITSHEMNVRPGGVCRFVMYGPNGVDYQNRVVYRENRRARAHRLLACLGPTI